MSKFNPSLKRRTKYIILNFFYVVAGKFRHKYRSFITNYRYQEKLGLSQATWRNLRHKVWRRDKHRCQICRKKRKNLTVDHILPMEFGGKSTMDNLQTLCEWCHKKKDNNVQKHKGYPMMKEALQEYFNNL